MRTPHPGRLLVLLALLAAPLSAQPLHTLASPNEEIRGGFGSSVSGAGDMDGDGVPDVVVGAQGEGPGTSPDEAGRAYVFSGATGALLHTLASPNEESRGGFGSSVSGAGDMDGDGVPDVVVGAQGEGPGTSPDEAGRAYVFSGATGALLHTLASPNEESRGGFGSSVSGAGDVDGDGVPDVVVGAQGEGPGMVPDEAGRAYVFSGVTGALLHTLASPNEESRGGFGSSVSGAGDVNGDGRRDVVVGAQGEGPGTSPDEAGRAYVFSGATGALLHTLASPNEEAGGFFGISVSGAGDADGDGRGDVVVGAQGEGPGTSPSEAGRAYVFSGATGALLHTLASPNEETAGQFGISVSGAGDVDGDGRREVVVGAYTEDPGTSPDGAGRAYVFSGATGALLHTLASPNEETDGQFGISVSGAGDADGDGRGDVVVGAHNENPRRNEAGRAYVFSAGVPITTAQTIDGPQGWRLFSVPGYAATFRDMLGPVWTQGALGAGSSDGDPVVFQYEEATSGDRGQGFAAVPDLRADTEIARGYAVYVFEDDDPYMPDTQGGFPKLYSVPSFSLTGVDVALPVSFNSSGALSEDGWNIVGNPHDAPLDWDAPGWTKDGLDNVIYVWNAQAGTFETWNGSAGSLGDGLVDFMTGFWVKAFEAGAALVAPADARTPEPPPPAPLGPSLTLRVEGEAGSTPVEDAAFLSFLEGASDGVDPYDAYELAPFSSASVSLYARLLSGDLLDIDARAPLAEPTSFSFDAAARVDGQSVGGAFTLSWPDLSALPEGWSVTLTDHATSQTIDLRAQPSYAFSLHPTSALAGSAPDLTGPPHPVPLREGVAKSGGSGRFTLSVDPFATASEEAPGAGGRLLPPVPNPARGTVALAYRLTTPGAVRLSLFDVLGREVAVLLESRQAAGTHRHSVPVEGLRPGVYLVRLEGAGRTDVQPLTVVR